LSERKKQIDDPFLHLLAKAVVSLNERQEEMVNILLEIRNDISSISTKFTEIYSQETVNTYQDKQESQHHPLLILSVKGEIKKTLTALVQLYHKKKRPISIKELETHLDFGYRTIAIHLKQLEDSNPPSIEHPITRRALEEHLKDIEKQGNPENIDIEVPQTAGRAYFYKPLDNIVNYIKSMN